MGPLIPTPLGESPRSSRPSEFAPLGAPRLPWRRMALVFAVAFACYANTLSNGFVFDDKATVEQNERIRGLDRLGEVWTTPYLGARYKLFDYYRPLTATTYALDYAVHGLRPAGYHLVNVLLHALIASLVLVLALRLGVPAPGALLGGILFAVHPLHTEAVAWVTGRSELLASLCYLVAFLFWLRFREGGRTADLAGIFIATTLGGLCKENLVTLPAVLVAAEAGFSRMRDRVERDRLVRAVAITVAGVALYHAVALFAIGRISEMKITYQPLTSGLLYGEPFAVRLWTGIKVFGHIVRLLAFPLTLSPDYTYNQIPLARAPDRSVLLGTVAACAAAAGLLRAWRTPRRFAMGAWAALAYAPIANVLVPMPMLLAERTLYLATIPLAVLLGDLLSSLALGRTGGRRAAVWLLVAFLAGLWAARTADRNRDWRDDMSLFSQAVRTVPNSAVMRMNYGIDLMQAGRTREGVEQLAIAARMRPELAKAHLMLSLGYLKLDRLPEAEEAVRTLLRMRPDRSLSWVQLTRVLSAQGRAAEARNALRRALEIDPKNPEALELQDALGPATAP